MFFIHNRNQTVLPYLHEISCLPVVEPSSYIIGGECALTPFAWLRIFIIFI
nr:MAG TPA: hypothetical protein [Caudoviricetes sp.]